MLKRLIKNLPVLFLAVGIAVLVGNENNWSAKRLLKLKNNSDVQRKMVQKNNNRDVKKESGQNQSWKRESETVIAEPPQSAQKSVEQQQSNSNDAQVPSINEPAEKIGDTFAPPPTAQYLGTIGDHDDDSNMVPDDQIDSTPGESTQRTTKMPEDEAVKDMPGDEGPTAILE